MVNSIVAKNTAAQVSGKDVLGQNGRSFTSGGNNRLTSGGNGFTNGLNGDYIGAVDYVITDLADSFNHTNDATVLSTREAIDTANTTAGTQEIWMPAWRLMLTRARNFATQLTDTDVTFGDLDIKDSLVIRGITGPSSVHWKSGVTDAVFELLGDYNGNGTVDAADYTVWRDHLGQTVAPGTNGDGTDSGVVEQADYDIWSANLGHTLTLIGVSQA
jgi:hypothetical protein